VNTQDDQITILIVDDEQSIREGSARILSRMGCNILKAANGEEGLDILTREIVEILLLDLKMPGIDGMEVLRRVKEKYPHILVIIMTGFATVETAIEAMKQGAYDFIPKPFEPDHIRLVVNRAREKLRLTREAEKLAQERKRTLLDLGTEKSRVRTIIEALPNGIIVTNAMGQVVLMNPAFNLQMDIKHSIPTGGPLKDYITDKGLHDFILEISQGKVSDSEKIYTHEFKMSGDKYLLARGRVVVGEDQEILGAIIIFVNITAMKLLDQIKSEFVAKVSHELRSPLSTIHEQLAVVLGEMAEEAISEKLKYLLNRAKEKTEGLISLIGDLLDLSRIEAGATSQEIRPIPLESLLKSIVDFLSTKANKKKQTLVMEPLPEHPLPMISADPMALESIFGNLITNAINYTPESGSISVEIFDETNSLCVKVKDTGYGIHEKHQQRIFERFFRVKDENTRYITGTGLGLPIVKGLVDSLGGTITIDSELGKGTTFIVVLPLDQSNGQDNKGV